MPVHIPDPMELVEFGEEVVINQHAHFLIGNGLHYFDHHPDAAPRQNSNRRPCWEMRCTLCRNKGHLFSKCSYKQAAPICTYCCRQGHIALRCNLRLDMNIELFSRGFVSMPIDPNDTQALAMDLPAGYVPARFGQPGHLDYRAAPFVEALQAQEQMLNEQAPNEVVTPVEAQQILPADMPLALLEPIGLQLPTGNETAPIEAVAPISDGEGSQPQPAVWIDPQLVAEIDAVLDRGSESESSDDEMDVSNDDEDSGEEEIIPQMGTIASLEEILRTLVITLQEELPRFRDIMVELVDKLQSGRHQAAK